MYQWASGIAKAYIILWFETSTIIMNSYSVGMYINFLYRKNYFCTVFLILCVLCFWMFPLFWIWFGDSVAIKSSGASSFCC